MVVLKLSAHSGYMWLYFEITGLGFVWFGYVHTK